MCSILGDFKEKRHKEPQTQPPIFYSSPEKLLSVKITIRFLTMSGQKQGKHCSPLLPEVASPLA